jgi:hypothetical protein
LQAVRRCRLLVLRLVLLQLVPLRLVLLLAPLQQQRLRLASGHRPAPPLRAFGPWLRAVGPRNAGRATLRGAAAFFHARPAAQLLASSLLVLRGCASAC